MNWYKMHHGLPQDPRLAVIAKRAGLRQGDMIAIWVALLDHASRAAPRGNVKDIDIEETAVMLGFDFSAIEAAWNVLHEKKMIQADGRITDWDRRQKSSTHRTRAHRKRMCQTETDAESRSRLQAKILARHKKRGLTLAEHQTMTPPEFQDDDC